jgi:hypothetical protein
MGRHGVLDVKILTKIAQKRGARDLNVIRKLVSARARRRRISAEAALIILAEEHGVGTAVYQRKLDPAKQMEARNAVPALPLPPSGRAAKEANRTGTTRSTGSARSKLRAVIEYVIQDPELRSRCTDILMAPDNFDRPINTATLVLEDRIRRKVQPPTRLVGENLVGFAFNEEAAKTRLQVAGAEPDDQRGFTQIMRGIVPAFRNRTHHHVTNTFSREDAMRVCGFIDVLLRVVDNAAKVS